MKTLVIRNKETGKTAQWILSKGEWLKTALRNYASYKYPYGISVSQEYAEKHYEIIEVKNND